MKGISNLSADEWAELSRLLDQALDLSDTQREPWLARLSVSQPLLAERVARALAVQRQQGFTGFLAEPLPFAAQTPPPATLVGRRVGPYAIDEEIGRGGMGSVWRAHRDDGRYDGIVAVKFVHASWIGQGGEARFRTEGISLGRLDHPNIARLLDAGLWEGSQPYIVLEYVEGDPIDVYCERHALRLQERVRLFLDVLAAVAHAHAHLVVHRDLKPANIFVAHDGSVKLLDFGIAKLLDDDGGLPTHATSVSLMTPLYAAPEQLLGEPVATATDVYALGLVLYRLLTGAHPQARETLSKAELLSAVLTKDPERASTVAGLEFIRPKALAGDLDNILGKALRKKPEERYDSAAAFADDLRRYLSFQPVHARPDTLRYRSGKFVRRHRGSVLTAAATAMVLVMTTGYALWQAREAKLERDTALTAERRADSVGEFLTLLVGNLGGSLGPQAVRPQLDDARQLLEKQRYDDPVVKANLLRYLAGRYEEFGDQAAGVTLLEEAQHALEGGADPIGSAQLDCSIANVDDGLGRDAEADRHIRRAVTVLTSLGESVRPQVRADCRVVESYVATSRGENRRAVTAARTALAEIENAGVRVGLQHDTVVNALARADAYSGFNAAAVSLMRGLRASDAAQGRDQTLGGWIHGYNEANDLLAGGRIEDAERLTADLQRASRQFAGDSATDDDIGALRGRVLLALERYPEAEPLLAHAATEGGASIVSLERRLALIETHLAGGDAAAARRELDAQPETRGAAGALGPLHTAGLLRVRALIALRAGDPQGAEAALERAGGLAVDADGEPSTEARRIAMLRGEAALRRGAAAEACRFAGMAGRLARREAADPSSSAWIGEALLLHARCDAAAGRWVDAKSEARSAAAQLEPNLGAAHSLTRRAHELANGPASQPQ